MRTAPVLPRAETAVDTGLSPDPLAVAELIAAAGGLARTHDREDLAGRLGQVGERVVRTDTVVCVVGEFKKGKSALINALLHSSVCPVDDDLATMAVTVVRYAPDPSAVVRRREGRELVVEAVPAEDVGLWVAEHDGEDRRGVEVVEVALPNPFLERGIALVDTPGVGGLNAAHAAATLAFLPSADALVFVTDASAELSAPELAFLASARSAGPPVLVAVTKVDIYPEWRRIVSIDADHLRGLGMDEEPFGLSSTLRADADALGDGNLDDESGYPRFEAALIGDAVARARAGAVASAAAQVLPALDQLREPVAAEVLALERPEAAARMAADLAEVRRRLAVLSDADASWSVRLEDEFATLRTRSEFAFQARMRQLLRESQDEVERIDPAKTWPELSQRVQQGTAAAVRGAFLEATEGAAAIQANIAGLLADEAVGFDSDGVPVSFDVSSLWQGGPSFDGRAKAGLGAGAGLLGGVSVGVEMLGMLGALLGAAVVGPAVLGVAAVFGGKEVLSERRRQLADRRQQARSFLAAFFEEVRFEADGRLASLLDDIQRGMRARFADRIRELHRTFADSAAALERASERAESDRRERLAVVRAELVRIDALRTEAMTLGTPAGGGAGAPPEA